MAKNDIYKVISITDTHKELQISKKNHNPIEK